MSPRLFEISIIISGSWLQEAAAQQAAAQEAAGKEAAAQAAAQATAAAAAKEAGETRELQTAAQVREAAMPAIMLGF